MPTQVYITRIARSAFKHIIHTYLCTPDSLSKEYFIDEVTPRMLDIWNEVGDL